MSSSTEQRRAALVEQSHRERAALMGYAQDIQDSIMSLCTGLQTASSFGKLPLLGLGAIAAVFIIKPKRALWVIKTGISCWQFWKKFKM